MRHHKILLSTFAAACLLPVFGARATVVKIKPYPSDMAGLSLSAVPEGWRHLPAVDLYIVDDRGQEVLDLLKKEGAVEAAEEDSDVVLEAVPNDPMLDHQGWVGEGGLPIGAEEAWDITQGSGSVVVAIIDTGVDADHEDLSANLWTNFGEIPGNGLDDDQNGFTDDAHGYNFWDRTADVTDENDHGTHLAGIIGAAGNNGIGIAGVDWRVRLMALRFTDGRGNGTSERAIEAIDYAIRNGARVINASWTLKLDSASDGEGKGALLKQAITKASQAGVLFVTAAGNQFQTGVGLDIDEFPVYPAAFDVSNIVSVSALSYDGSLAGYSNYGSSSVGIAAPGTNIYSTLANGGYGYMTGTSIATAVVAGSAALALAANSALTPQQLKAVLEGTSIPDAGLSGRVSSGGRLNLSGAVEAAKNGNIPDAPVAARTPDSISSSPVSPSRSASSAGGGCSLIP